MTVMGGLHRPTQVLIVSVVVRVNLSFTLVIIKKHVFIVKPACVFGHCVQRWPSRAFQIGRWRAILIVFDRLAGMIPTDDCKYLALSYECES